MTIFTHDAATVAAPYAADGTPRKVDNTQMQVLLTEMQRVVDVLVTNSGKIYGSKAAMYADLTPAANTPAVVLSDATPANNGFYMKVGGTGTGSWSREGGPPGATVIPATNAGAGTANAIVATTPYAVESASALVLLPITDDNTSTSVTVAFNGGTALTVKSSYGANPPVGSLVAGTTLMGFREGTTFRLISGLAPDTVQAAAEAAQAAAEAAAATATAVTGIAGVASEAEATNLVEGDADNTKVMTVLRTLQLVRELGFVTPRMFGTFSGAASGSQNSTALNAALADADVFAITIPGGEFDVTAPIEINDSAKSVRGVHTHGTKLVQTTTDDPLFLIGAALTGVQITDMFLDRDGTAVDGGDGIRCADGYLSYATFERLLIDRQYNGMRLAESGGYSNIRQVVIDRSQGDGLRMLDFGTYGLQWYLDGILSQRSGLRGYFVQGAAGSSAIAMGDWTNIRSWGNSGYGIAVVDDASRVINGFRLHTAFLGEDGDSEIYLDVHGGLHTIDNVFAELAGTRTTGPALGTAASGNGSGIHVTANVDDVLIQGGRRYGNSDYGAYSAANVMTQVVGGSSHNNGSAGVYVADGSKLVATGHGGSGNGGGILIDAATNLTQAVVGDNFPQASATMIQGPMSVGNPTGGLPSAGSINIAGDIRKNNTAYTNP